MGASSLFIFFNVNCLCYYFLFKFSMAKIIQFKGVSADLLTFTMEIFKAIKPVVHKMVSILWTLGLNFFFV